MDCIFCKLGSGEIPSKKIAESSNAIAFLDVNPVAPGHTVVTPKKHAETILDLDDTALAGLFSVVKEATAKIKAGLNPDGFNIGLNHGRVGGQAIPHVHVHILPRFENDGGGSMHTIVRNPPKENLDEIERKIRAASPSATSNPASNPAPAPVEKKEEPKEEKKKTMDEELAEKIAEDWIDED